MSPVETGPFAEILDQVRGWPPETRIVLARRILETLDVRANAARPRAARSVEDWIGMGAGPSAPPDDETLQRWVDEHRAEKYG